MATARARPVPTARAVPLTLPATDLLAAVTVLAGAASQHDVATAVCSRLLEVSGVRASAVLQRRGGAAVVVGSAGYDCDAMAAGARLPLDSGLPAAEALRTGDVVLQGTGPGWCAVPFGRRTSAPGVLLLSLTAAPPTAAPDVVRLQQLATTVGAALHRAESYDRVTADLAGVVAGLAPRPLWDGEHVAVRQRARGGLLGGDVMLTAPDGADGRWLVSADVCGSGLPAATGAAAVRSALLALAPVAEGPADLLRRLDAALRPEAPDGGFVTATVVHLGRGLLRAASAGHPAPLLLTASGATELVLEPGPPLALETTDGLPPPVELIMATPTGALLALYSDGVTERRGCAGAELEVGVLLAAAVGARTPAELADALVAAAEQAGPAEDDTSVLAARL